MVEPISGVEKVIGFIYRILFTIIPSGAFLCVSFLFLHLYSPATVDSLKSLFSGINAFWQVLLPLCLIFSLSLFIESLDLLIFYYMMDFGNLTNLRIFGEKNATPLYDLKSRDFSELYNNTNSDTSIQRFVQKSHYSLALIKSLMHHPRVFSHIYYQLGREFVFNNLTVVVLLISNCFAPYVIASFGGGRHTAYQTLQPILSVAYLILSYILLKKYNAYKTGDNQMEILGLKYYFEHIHKMPYFLFTLLAFLLIVSCLLFPSAVSRRESWKLFLAFNCVLFPILITMVFKGFKEYLNVEKYYLAYFVEKHFVKSSKELQVKDWNFRRTSDYPDAEFENHIAPKILDVYQNGMGRQGWSIEKIVEQKKASTLLGLLEDVDRDIFGYCFVTIPTNKFRGKRILWIDSCSILSDLQASGFYRKAIKRVISLFDRDSFGYLGGRTQNPIIMYSHDNYGKGNLLPFDEFYSDDLIQFLIANIGEVGKPHAAGKLDKETGVCKQTYEGILGKYPSAFSKGRCSVFEEKLIPFGFDRNNGDAIIILKEL